MGWKTTAILAGMIILITACSAWSGFGRLCVQAPVESYLTQIEELGKDNGCGNLLAVQPYMMVSDYASPERFQAKLELYLKEAEKLGLLNSKTVVVLPEYLGAWLVVAGEKQTVYTAPSVGKAMQIMAVSNIISFSRAVTTAEGNDRLKDAMFRMKANSMAEAYNTVFSQLAGKYQITIIAGSIILPEPSTENGRLVVGDGPLYNVSPVYLPDGLVSDKLVTKIFPTEDEQGFIAAGKMEDLPVFDTPAGDIGVLICADAWFPKCYEFLYRKGASAVVVPSYISGDKELENIWSGYSGFANPQDVQEADVGKITQRDAWMKYALSGRLEQAGIEYGMMSCLRGQLWDMGSDGSITIIKKGETMVGPDMEGAAVVNMWL